MTSYSSEQFWKDWRFLIDKDFVTPSGKAFDYAQDGRQEWGFEKLNIPFVHEPNVYRSKPAVISQDAKYIALWAKCNVIVYELAGPKHVYTLQGHVSEVDAIAFRPGASNQLVTVAMMYSAGATPAQPEIIFWDLANHSPNPIASTEVIERLSRNAANSIIADMKLLSDSVPISANDQFTLAKAMEDPITKFAIAKGSARNVKLWGRLQSGFQSQVFSPSGQFMFYMPGNAPRSNGDNDWELRVWSLQRRSDHLILSGNRDSIMWAGYNHDESLIGTACWDGSFRIWDVVHGQELRRWNTRKQNWTAAFSPDGKYFAGTSGDDKLHVYNLSDGTEHMTFDAGRHWSRTIAWHPTSKLIATGGDPLGKVFLVDVEKKEAIQHRKLSTKAMVHLPEDRKLGVGTFLTVSQVRFVDQGRKLAFFTMGDGSIEVYDLEQYKKWRFARAGTMNPPENHLEVTSKGGNGMTVCEDHANKKIILASVDNDAVRVWTLPMTSSS